MRLNETFFYHGWEWHIGPALRLLEGRAPVEIGGTEFAPMLDEDIDIDTSHTACDLTDPVLVCDLAVAIDGHTRLLIDGWHRLNHAIRTGVMTLPALMLTTAEGLSVSERAKCYGCGHCTHIQFDGEEPCYRWCDTCIRENPCDAAAWFAYNHFEYDHNDGYDSKIW